MPIKPLQDKFDLTAVAALAHADAPTLRPLLPELLAWLQDSNWLIAAPLAEILRPHQQAFDAEIATVLCGDDAVWKTSLLAGLLDCRAGDETVRTAERIARCRAGRRRRRSSAGFFDAVGGIARCVTKRQPETALYSFSGCLLLGVLHQINCSPQCNFCRNVL